MFQLFAIIILAFSVVVAFQNWRTGIYIFLFVGLLQGPFRKLTPGVPAYYLLWAAAVFGAILFAAWSKGGIGRTKFLALQDDWLHLYGRLFLLLLVFQSFHSLIRWGNPILPIMGLVFYLSPVMGILVGLGYARSESLIDRFVIGYVILFVPAALTVYLSSRYQTAYPVLQEVGMFVGSQLRIYDVGTVLHSYAGIFRVGEIAAWHAATGAVFLTILAVRKPSHIFRIIAGILVVALIGAIIMTGRRKMLMLLSIFLVLFGGGLFIFRRGAGRILIAAMIIGLIGSYGLTLFSQEREHSLYLERSVTVYDEVDDRFSTTMNLLRSAIFRSSWIGLGVGVASQGAQHAGGAISATGGAGEAGIGKIVLELGIPGLLLLVILMYRLEKRIWWFLKQLNRFKDPSFYYALAFSVFIIANLATFFVATQLYGDPFILLILGLISGMLFRILLESGVQIKKEAAEQISLEAVQHDGFAPTKLKSIPS